MSSEKDALQNSLLKNNVKGVINSEKDFSKIPDALNALESGASWYSDKIFQSCFEKPKKTQTNSGEIAAAVNLTKREREILVYLTKGLRNQAIADELELSYRTVVTHVYNIYRKLKIKSRTEAIRFAITNKLVDMEND